MFSDFNNKVSFVGGMGNGGCGQKKQQKHLTEIKNCEFITACMHLLSLGGDMSEEDMLQAAMNMSLESVRNHLNSEEEK